jgi:serine/threonine-protein kinase
MGSTSQFTEPAPPVDPEKTAAHLPPVFPSKPDEPTVISKLPAAEALGTVVPAPSHELSKLLAGEKLGHYELLEFAGGGGMGAVFRARDTMLHREVAIKVLSRDQATDEETLRRFKNEAQSAARLDHHNIARVYYVGEDRGLHYIVFEFVEGLNIRQLVDRNGPLPLDQAISYVTQVTDALDHAWTRDVVHRDIKPSNIVITSQGRAKLVDMGLARFHGLQPNGDLTASGVTLGTFDYISPEQARDPRTADVRSDIYSLGCTLYFMLTGRPPFPDGTVLQKLLQHNSDDPIDPREFNPDLPAALTTLMRKMLAKDPARRYQTPTELVADLVHFSEQFGLRQGDMQLTSNWTETGGGPTAVTRHLTWLVPALGLIVAFFALEWWGRRTDDRWTENWAKAHAAQSAVAPPPRSGGNNRNIRINGATTAAAVAPNAVASATSQAPGTSAVGSPADPILPLPSTAAAGVLPAPRDGVLVVCDSPGDGRYTSLRAACFAARNGDVIELCYDGPRIEKPLALSNLKVTVRGGTGFRPIVRFEPGDVLIPNAPHAMMTVVGSRMEIVGVDVDFVVPSPQDVPADSWSLFDLQQAEHLGLERSTITIRNAAADGRSYHPDAAVFSMSSPPGMTAGMMTDDMNAAQEPVEIRLDDVLVRGEASLLRSTDLQAASLVWSNGVLAVADSALVVRGGQMMPREAPVRLDLHHVTAAVGGEWIKVTNGFDAPFLPALAVRCADSILLSTSGRPLLDYEGIDARGDFLSTFEWTADRVVYDGFPADTFWRFQSSTAGLQILGFDAWQQQWGPERELRTQRQSIRRLHPQQEPLSFHAAVADDFALDPMALEDKALGAAGDGTDLGVDRAAMRLPYETATETGDAAAISP